jgi:hypothetical protein
MSASGYVAPVGPEGSEEDRKIEGQIKRYQKQHDAARLFDKNFRKQIAKDRRYAAGTWDSNWAVSANVVGYVIDILTSILYARDPDLNVRKAPQVDDEQKGNQDIEQWARTLELVISLLWKKAPLRVPLKQQVRGTLTASTGWLKANLLTEKVPQPEVEKALNDAIEKKEQIKAQKELIDDPVDPMSEEEEDTEEAELDAMIESSKSKLEKSIRKEFVIEYVPAQNVQMSLDVARDEDYLNADWIDFELYVPKVDTCSRFNDLKEEDLLEAKLYYQRQDPDRAGQPLDNSESQSEISSESAELYSTSQPGDEDVAFVKSIERWCRTDGFIYTWVEGVKKWAKEPFQPNYSTSRFYPCFRLAFFDVDGQRHAQSIPYRISKLQDEYSCARSNYRLARERSIPGILFDATNIPDTEAEKIAKGKSQELIAIKPIDPTKPFSQSFAPKPTAPIDPRVFDTTPILADINRITGVQEALQGAVSGPKTATEAQLEQMGMNARTTSDRDTLEWMLTDLACYTGECAIQGLKTDDVMAMVGSSAMWPEGIGADALRRLVNITIEAGSTGKPRKQSDQAAWGTVLPLIEKEIGAIVQARETGNVPLAKALEELVKETMRRMGDESDVERFIPQVQPKPPGPPPAPMPNISISLKGEISPQEAAAIAASAVPPGAALPGGAPPSPGAAPAAAGPSPAGAAPGPIPGQVPAPPGPPPGSVPPVH